MAMTGEAKRPGNAAGPFFLSERWGLEVHTSHATATWGHPTSACILLRHFGHHGFGGDQQRRNRGRVLDRGAHDLRRVDDALRDQVAVFAGLRVEAVGILLLLEDLADDDAAVLARVDRDLTGRRGQRLAHDLDAGLLVVVLGLDALELLGRTEQGDAAARYDAFLDGCAGRV